MRLLRVQEIDRKMFAKIQPRYAYALGALVLTLGVALGATLRSPRAPEPDTKRPNDPAIQKLASLLARTEGRPAPADLMAFESANGGTRAAALARFLRGYLASDA